MLKESEPRWGYDCPAPRSAPMVIPEDVKSEARTQYKMTIARLTQGFRIMVTGQDFFSAVSYLREAHNTDVLNELMWDIAMANGLEP